MSREAEITELGGGAHRITMPLPWALDHVHCYALEAPEGWTIIDAGLGTPGTVRRWGEVLEQLGNPMIHRLVVTHYHPDHIGCGGLLAELVEPVEIVQGRLDAALSKNAWVDMDIEGVYDHMFGNGMSTEMAREAADDEGGSPVTIPEPTHLEDNIDDIDRCFGQTTLQGLVQALQATDSDWGRSTLERVESMSPTALKVTFALLRRAATCDNLEECVRTEWRLAHRSWPDQREGVRAFEKEKDGKPVWSETLSNEEVSALFQPIDPARMSKLNLVQDHLKSTPPSSPSQSMPGVSK